MADANQPTRNGGNASGAQGRKTLNAFDPRNPSLVQPFKRLVDEGFISELVAKWTPMGIISYGKAAQKLADVEDSGLNTTDEYPLAILARVAEKGDVIPRPGKAKKTGGTPQQALPAKSLCKEDLKPEKTAASIQARANAVARASGGAPLVGRVRSKNRFLGHSTTSYQDWWETASADDRALSLCQGKHYASLTDEEKAKLAGLQCPFRGTLEFTVAEEAEDEEE
jgi:hypothetical protein